ncbi:MAG: DUF2974 domain-containing protein [Clostridia bacterium]|nr:DUF2974 domain-containing protein [Clostridia bacterium]
MATMLDYLYWRGDIGFETDPFNEVDGLVLARLAYLPFDRISLKEKETIGAAVRKMKKLKAGVFSQEEDVRFLALLEDADRFNRLVLTDFVREHDEEAVKQFSAITIHLGGGVMYISFCGTDASLVGWKEDFYMSFMQDIPAQLEALEYVKTVAAEFPNKTFRLGGHSKGGNLAVYAAVNLPEDLRERLIRVCNFDGPGFPPDFIARHDFGAVLDRLNTYIPQESMFGRIHEHVEGYTVVESGETGVQQHNLFSWNVRPKNMKKLKETDSTSEIAYEAIQNILRNTTPAERKKYVDSMFDLLDIGTVSTISDLKTQFFGHFPELIRKVTDSSMEDHLENTEVTGKMVKSALEAVADAEKKKVNNLLDNMAEKLESGRL